MTGYECIQLKPNLVLLRWHRTPDIGDPIEARFIRELRQMLDEAEVSIYFISDLRKGKMINALTLRRLGQLTQHRKWAGSTAFSADPVTNLMVNVFKRYVKGGAILDNRNLTWNTPEEAIAYLESLHLGLTQAVDWPTVIEG